MIVVAKALRGPVIINPLFSSNSKILHRVRAILIEICHRVRAISAVHVTKLG